MNDKEIKPKPCPFCGKDVKMNNNSHIRPKRYFIICRNCGIIMPSAGNGFNSKKRRDKGVEQEDIG